MRIVALIVFAVIAGRPAWAAQPAAPEPALPGSLAPLGNKEALELMLKALGQQQTETGNPGTSTWQMLGAASGPAPAVWLLNSSTGELSFCTVPATGRGIICYTKK